MPRTWSDEDELMYAQMDHDDPREPEDASEVDPTVMAKLTNGQYGKTDDVSKVGEALFEAGFLQTRLPAGSTIEALLAAIGEAGEREGGRNKDPWGRNRGENPQASPEPMPVSMSLTRGGLQPVRHALPDAHVMAKLTGGAYRGRTTPHSPSGDADRAMLERLGGG